MCTKMVVKCLSAKSTIIVFVQSFLSVHRNVFIAFEPLYYALATQKGAQEIQNLRGGVRLVVRNVSLAKVGIKRSCLFSS